jgi:hypothetical protein
MWALCRRIVVFVAADVRIKVAVGGVAIGVGSGGVGLLTCQLLQSNASKSKELNIHQDRQWYR